MLDAADIAALRGIFRELLGEEVARVVRGETAAPQPLMTIPEVATLLRTSAKAIHHRIERGQLPGVVRDGKRLLIRRAKLLRYLSEGRGPSPGSR